MGFFGQPATFFRSAGNPDDPAALELGNLPGNRAGCPGRARYHAGLAGFGLPDVQNTEICGQARHSQDAQRPGQGSLSRNFCRRHQTAPLTGRGILLPAKAALHALARLKTRMTRLHDLAHAQGTHDLANLDRRDIALAVFDPAAHGRLKGEV